MVWFPELRGKMEQESVEGKANALPGMTGKRKWLLSMCEITGEYRSKEQRTGLDGN